MTCCNVYINGLLIIINSNDIIRLISFVICNLPKFYTFEISTTIPNPIEKNFKSFFFNKMHRNVSLNNKIEVYTVVYWNRIVFSKSFPNIYRLQVELFSVNREKFRSSVLIKGFIHLLQTVSR